MVNNLLELAIISLLITFPELFKNQEISTWLDEAIFSGEYADFIHPERVHMLAEKVLPIINKNNPGFFSSAQKADVKKVLSKMLRKYKMIALQKQYNDLAASDPKKFLEIYSSYKLQMDELLDDDDSKEG